MQPERPCLKCGRKIPWGQIDCPFCPDHRGFLWSLRRDMFLLVILSLLLLLFVITSFTTRIYHDVERGYAEEWYTRGGEDLSAGRAGAALVDFRTALSYSRDNDQFKLRLAQALMMPGIQGGTGSEARIYLLDLLEHEPANGIVNLELARLSARNHAVPDALRFYHGAIYGEWNGDSAAQRRAARLELAEFLLEANEQNSARAELIDLAANLPPDPALQTQVGSLLLEVKGYDDALKLFHQALLEDPRSPAALAGAGECHFQLGEYAQAEHYLRRALEQDSHLAKAAAMLATVRLVLDNDPFLRRLDNSERAQRAELDFNTALERLQTCATQKGTDLKTTGGDPLQILYSQVAPMQLRAREEDLSQDSELLSQVMDATFEIEQTTAHLCGEPQGMDMTLLLMARESGGTRR